MSFHITGGSSPEPSYSHRADGEDTHGALSARQLLGPHGWDEDLSDHVVFSNAPHDKEQHKEQQPFSLKRAGKEVLKGVARPFKFMAQHPWLTVGALTGTIALMAAAPMTIPLMVAGGLGYSVFQCGKGGFKAWREYHQGNFENAEKAFGDIGEGAFSLMLSVFGFRTSAAIAAESRTTVKGLKAATSQSEKIEAFQKGIDAAKATKYGAKGHAFKEYYKLIATKDGWQAIGSQLKPRRLFSNLRLKTGNLIRLFKKPPQSDIQAIAKKVQASQGIADQDMPKIVALEKSRPGIVASYNPETKTVEVTTDYLELFKAQDQGAGIYCFVDHLPRFLQNFFSNLMRRKVNLENILAHEIRHSQQHGQIQNLSVHQANQFINQSLHTIREQLHQQGITSAQEIDEAIETFASTYKKILDYSKFSTTDALGGKLVQGKQAFTQWSQGMLDNTKWALKPLDPESLRAYISTPIEVDARRAGTAYEAKDIFDKLNTTPKMPEPFTARKIRNALIENRQNDLIEKIRQLPEANAPASEISPLEQELHQLRRLPGSHTATGSLLKQEALLAKSEKLLNYFTRLFLKIKRLSQKDALTLENPINSTPRYD